MLARVKARYPDRIALIRGNHESREITQIYGFYDEVVQKYNTATVWRACCDVFDCISLGALIDGKVFAVHGGLSPAVQDLDQLRLIDRVKEVPHEGAMSDMLWSDPDDSVIGWGMSPRGAGYLFGADIASQFLHTNDLCLIARAHQLVMEGYKWMFDKSIVTVWSAPNYCYRCGNVASIMTIDEQLVTDFKIFTASTRSAGGLWPTKAPPMNYFL